MFKGVSRFQQSRASSGRSLSGYPKELSRRTLFGAETEFEIGSIYIKRLTPLVHALLKSGLNHSEFGDELRRHRISTPSGKPWNESLVGELICAVHLKDKKIPRNKTRRRK
jgi:hypothetical protein